MSLVSSFRLINLSPPLTHAVVYLPMKELHNLLRVVWSGKWAVVTPYALLDALWRFVPRFRNYQQQDAQVTTQATLYMCPNNYDSSGLDDK